MTMDQEDADLLCALGQLGINIPPHDSIDDIARGFDGLGLSKLATNQTSTLGPNACYHELHLEFPAMSLLPKGATPYLWQPRSVHHRESPRMGSFYHDVDNLAFFTRFDTGSSAANSDMPGFTQPEDICSAVSRLANAPGISNLEVVAYYQSDTSTVHYNTRLRTTWLAENTRTVETHAFNYIGLEWGIRIACTIELDTKNKRWAVMLQHLMDRASDRAYLHVRERLRAHSTTLACANDETWSAKWDSAPRRSPNELLVNNIIWHHNVGAELPCGCVIPDLSTFYLTNVTTEEEAAAFRCPNCLKPVLRHEEMETAFLQRSHRIDRRQRLKAKIDEQCWAALPSQLRSSSSFEVAHADLQDAIKSTLRTFALPKSVLPAATCPTMFRETAIVTARLAAILTVDKGALIVVIPAAMPRFFLEMAEDALREDAGLVAGRGVELNKVLPAGYIDFLLRWFTRAVTMAAYQVQKRDDQVADQLMDLMMGKKGLGKLGASWWAQPVRES